MYNFFCRLSSAYVYHTIDLCVCIMCIFEGDSMIHVPFVSHRYYVYKYLCINVTNIHYICKYLSYIIFL